MTNSGLALVEEPTVTSNACDEPTLRNDNELLASIIGIQQEIATAELRLNDVMHLIAERTQHLTEADGAVIELAEGDEFGVPSGHWHRRFVAGTSAQDRHELFRPVRALQRSAAV